MSKNSLIALILNIILLVFEIIGTILSVDLGIVANLIHYTQLSNFLSLIATLIFVIFVVLKHGQEEIPVWIKMFKYLTVCCLALTLITTYVVLIPMEFGFANYLYGFKMFALQGSMLFFHTLAPILACISFMFFEGDRRLNKKKTIYIGMLLTFVYGFILILLNVLKVVEGPYPFLKVYAQPWYMSIIWIAVIFSVNYIFARFILLENQKHAYRIKKNKHE